MLDNDGAISSICYYLVAHIWYTNYTPAIHIPGYNLAQEISIPGYVLAK